ncbi:hypothetical protein TH63_11220 [Rufibacter radiotolerans]|uniref:Uncharacterized protein n=1 Tax=Rufibacter radiotolerans TaxID=1379910 RepID=A0A0H4VQ90_9BACT|nr:hypothetical protein TH63_11220 [Rufibacter radiotolerans]
MQKGNLCVPLHSLPRRGFPSQQGEDERGKKSLESVAQKRIFLTFALPSSEGPGSRKGGREREKKLHRSLAERELVLTFAAPSGRKPLTPAGREREKKKFKIIACKAKDVSYLCTRFWREGT